jgi:hypothetical protein
MAVHPGVIPARGGDTWALANPLEFESLGKLWYPIIDK